MKLWIWYLPLNFRFLFHERSTIHKSANIHKSESESCSVVSDFLWPHGLYSPWNSPGQNTGMGRLSLLQGIFPTQGSNPGLLHWWQILYQLSHKGSPNIHNTEMIKCRKLMGIKVKRTTLEKGRSALVRNACPLQLKGRARQGAYSQKQRMPWKATYLLIMALFTIAKAWKQPKCSPTDKWIKMWYMCTREYCSVL